MKKIDLMLRVLFLAFFANVSFGQGGLYPGGTICEEAIPIGVADSYSTAADGAGSDHWYTFVAPCDGELEISHAGANECDKRIYTGVCGSLTEVAGSTWSTAAIFYDMDADEEVYIKLNDSWDGLTQFNIRYENPACPQPTSLDAFAPTYDEAILAWFGPSSDYIVTYGPAGFDPAIGGTTVLVSGTSTTITGLSELTCYDFYVQADCGGGVVSCFLSGPGTVCTPAICPAPLFPNETGVTNTETTLNWSAGASESAWDVEWGEEGFVLGDGTEVLGTPFTSESLSGLTAATCYDWYVRAECEVDLGIGLETVYSLWVGPQEWCTNANCLNPSDGTMISSGGINATLTWDENNTPPADEWNIQYGTPGFELGSGVTVTNIPSNPYTLGGLTAGTDYCYYVQSVCGEGADSLSGWAGPFCFTTTIFCEEPTSLFGSGTSATEATLTWTAGGVEEDWEVSWGAAPLDDPMDGTMESASVFSTLGLTGLEAGESYCYFVRANCGDGADSASFWAGPFCWTQPALCETPFALDIINITNTAANIDFASVGAESFDVQWGLPCYEADGADMVGEVVASTEDPIYMTGLMPSTPYWVYIRATCGVDSVSAWSDPVLFGTDITNDNPCDAEALVLDGPAILRHNFDATTLPGEAALAPEASGCTDFDGWCGGDGVDRTVWFTFEAPASGQVNLSTFNESTCFTNGFTEMAIYSTGDCSILDNYVVEAANSLDEGALGAPYGSTITACGLTPGQTYYVMVNPISYIQTEVHFSIELTSVEEVSAGLGLSPTICAGSSYDLFDAIAGFSDEDGQWYNPSVGPGNELPNLVSFPSGAGAYTLYYVVDNGCDADTVETVITTTEGVNAGGDGFFGGCPNYTYILSDHISGAYDGGGIWSYDGDADADGVLLDGGVFTGDSIEPGVYTFIYTVASEYCPTDSAVVTITVEGCLSVNDEVVNNLVVFPNPVTDILTVQNVAIEGNAVIEVIDIEGRVIISNTVSNVFGNYTIDMSSIETGVYFIKVTTDETVQKVRVVKK